MASSLAKWVTSTMLIIVGTIHLLPLGGVTGGDRLQRLYGFAVTEPGLEILLRHRAVLFGLLGTYLVYAAFRPAAQPTAFVAGFVSVLSFLWLAHAVGDYDTAIGRIVMADRVALACLAVGILSYIFQSSN
ncbi:MAG: hypothetical protein QNJ14_18355 [Woeseiaceae bacterium]|nr:hypothetical protein [Woeseiaceae bacterium]